MSTELVTTEPVNEGSTARYRCTITDDGAAISSAAVTALTVTLRDETTDAVINSRDTQSVLNANGGTLAANGAFALVLGPTDNIAAAGNGRRLQLRRMTFRATYDNGAVTWERYYLVRALADIS